MHPGWDLYVVPGLIFRTADLVSPMSHRISADLRVGWALICLNHHTLTNKGWSTIDGIRNLSKTRKTSFIKDNFDLVEYGLMLWQASEDILYILNDKVSLTFARSSWPSQIMSYHLQGNIQNHYKRNKLLKGVFVLHSALCQCTAYHC